MKIFIIPLILLLSINFLTACGESKEEKISKISKIEEKIIGKDENSIITGEQYKLLSIENDDIEYRGIINGFYTRLLASFLDPETDRELKNNIILFLETIEEKEEVNHPLRTKLSTRTINGKEHLWLMDYFFTKSLFDMKTTLYFYQELTSLRGIVFDLRDENFLSNALCSAVDHNQVLYTSALLSLSDGIFDPGAIRCVSDGRSGKVVFTGNTSNMRYDYEVKEAFGVCPMSLRRLSGVNYADAVSLRISNWQNNLEQIDRNSIKSLDDAKRKIKNSMMNISTLHSVDDMNSLLDPYNKWAFGGDCSLEIRASK